MSSAQSTVEEEKGGHVAGSLADRLKVWAISSLGYWTIRFIGKTLRWEVEGSEGERAILASGKRIIYVFWHGRIFSATYFFRHRGIVVMTSSNKDGEYIARVIRRFGYGAARGSSSRGGRRALVEMARELKRRRDVAFTIDGPRGPRYQAKSGAAYLSWKTGDVVLPFCISPEKKWVMNSWDRFQVPKPFTKTLVLFGPPIHVQPGSPEEEIDRAQQKIQQSLEELRSRGDLRWGDTDDSRS